MKLHNNYCILVLKYYQSYSKQYRLRMVYMLSKVISMAPYEIKTTSQQRTEVLLPMCPLFGASTVYNPGSLNYAASLSIIV